MRELSAENLARRETRSPATVSTHRNTAAIMRDMQNAPFDQIRFREALGRFPTGVAVVTACAADGEPIGMTINSFSSVSLDPPLVLFSIARRAKSFAAWQAVSHYAVNVLAEDQEALSNRFAKAGPDRFADLAVEAGPHGLPLFRGALAVLVCEAHARYDGGDHEIFLGRVTALSTAEPAGGAPLVFFSGRYRRLAASGQAHVAPGDSLSPRGIRRSAADGESGGSAPATS
ncbi:Nitrilotriacetate monooxygenase component B [Rhodovulum sp. PH10]|nr:Nitrilotriacetate monooxygenase component B [Rhodovulum sp. PH10]